MVTGGRAGGAQPEADALFHSEGIPSLPLQFVVSSVGPGMIFRATGPSGVST